LGCGAAVFAGAALYLLFGSDRDLPRINRAADYHPKVTTKILSSDGELIGELFEERRTVVPRAQIPSVMIHALVDAEDAQYFEHHGLSYWGILRAILSDLKPGGHMQGASTLTQQLVRNLILKSNARSGIAGLKRKVQEMILARRIEDKLSKDEILWLYLNQIEFPYQRFGIEEATRFYFGKGVAEVNAGEAALLASLPKGPSEIDPWRHPERAKDRQRYVLSQMVRYGHLSKIEAENWARAPITLVKTPTPALGTAPEYVDEVKRLLLDRVGAERLPYLGATVKTYCDSRIQKLAREALEKGLLELDGRHGYRKPIAHLHGAQLASHLKRLRRELPNGPSMGKIVEGVVVALTPEAAEVDLGATRAKLPLGTSSGTLDRYNPKGLSVNERFLVGDVLRVRVVDTPPERPPVVALELGPQAAAVIIDPTTRGVRALVGGYGFHAGGFDRALSAHRQPGSAFKPFVYATALSTGRFTPATVLIDSPQVYAQPGMAPWKPKNAEPEYLGPLRLRVALAKSLNTIASQLVDVERQGVDPKEVVRLARDLGIESPLKANPSLALGTSEVTPLELTNAYASFASGGRRRAPLFISEVQGDGRGEAPTNEVEVLKPELAFLVNSMLSSVIDEGTAASARGKLKRPAAGKTGTTDSQKDAWFIGYTPDLVAGIWVGFDDMRELGRGEQGARAALPIWVEIMNGALKGVPPKPFLQPAGVVVLKIDPTTGLLAPPGATNAIEEYFLDGTQPTETTPAPGDANPDTYIMDQMQ
jgi:penicillin-binding protein 1A